MLAAKSDTLSGSAVAEIEAAVKSTDSEYLLEEIPRAIEQTLEGVTRVATLVSAMKEFSHPDTKEKVPLDLNRSINSTITVARNEWKYVSDLETDFDATLPLISCLPGEFNQVILNLIVNASHAIAEVTKNGGPAKGKITVQTRNCAEWAEIRIQDSGTGIPEKVRARIFDPFFTTKEIGKGTGQGLAIARSVVVDKHGGSIHFETEEGKGTTFVVRLPYDGKPLSTKAVAA
jgi:signal transduction histidine kinase